MKKLPITKEAFEKSKYFTNKYGKLEYVSESGKLFKTTKGKIMKFKESAIPMNEMEEDEDEFDGRWVAGMFCLQDEVGSSKIFYSKEDALNTSDVSASKPLEMVKWEKTKSLCDISTPRKS